MKDRMERELEQFLILLSKIEVIEMFGIGRFLGVLPPHDETTSETYMSDLIDAFSELNKKERKFIIGLEKQMIQEAKHGDKGKNKQN